MTDQQLLDWFERFREWRKETDNRLAAAFGTIQRLCEKSDALEAEIVKLKAKPKPRKAYVGKTYTKTEIDIARRVLNKINEHAGTNLHLVRSGTPTNHVKAIVARLRKGGTEHEMRLVAWHKGHEFSQDDSIGRDYAKPSTLFIDCHWDDYLDAAEAAHREINGTEAGSEQRQGPGTIGEIVSKLEVVK